MSKATRPLARAARALPSILLSCAAPPEAPVAPVTTVAPTPSASASATAPHLPHATLRTLDVAGQTTCLVRGGKVYCFGDRAGTQSWSNDASPTSHPTPVAGVGDAMGITLARDHACVLRSGGAVACWGVVDDGAKGESGPRGGYDPRTVAAPEAVQGLAAVQIAAGDGFTCAVDSGGRVLCWGMNERGGLGDDSKPGRLDPRPIAGLDSVVEVAASGGRACARRSGGEVRCWGSDPYDSKPSLPRAVDELQGATSLAVGGRRVCTLREGGALACITFSGKQVDKDPVQKLEAVQVDLDDGGGQCVVLSSGKIQCDRSSIAATQGEIDDAVSMANGGDHACVLTRKGALKCWGANGQGESGQGFRVNIPSPARVEGVIDATRVAMAQSTACAIIKDGAVVCWGSDAGGGLGDGQTEDSPDPPHFTAPQPVTGVAGAKAIAAADSRFCALLASGKVTCWGRLGGTTCDGPCLLPSPWQGLSDAVEVTGGDRMLCVVRRAGTVVCFGDPFSVSGGGAHAPWKEPGPAPIPGLAGVSHFTAGYMQGCAVRRDGTVACVGSAEDFGFMRAPKTRGVSVDIQGARDVVGFGVGQPDHELLRSGDLVALDWGRTFVVDPARPDRLLQHIVKPKTVLKDVVKVVQYQYLACALGKSGEVVCSDGDQPPVPSGVTDAVDVAHSMSGGSCAVRRGGEVFCWGSNMRGECGTDPNIWVDHPTDVAGLPAGP